MQYGRELQNLKVMLEIERKRTTEEKLAALAALPKNFSNEESTLRRRKVADADDEADSEIDNEEKVSYTNIKVQNEAVNSFVKERKVNGSNVLQIYKADIRRQLMATSKTPIVADETNMPQSDFVTTQENRQAELSEELLRLTTALKHNAQVAGSVIKEDNMVI